MRPLLLDTGPFVALIDRRDAAHTKCMTAFESIDAPLLSTEAVLTETLHLLGTHRAQDTAVAFVLRGAVQLVPFAPDALERCRHLMHKYADTPMDYADATLVRLAEEVDTDRVFTLDRRGFKTYRRHGRGAFRLVP